MKHMVALTNLSLCYSEIGMFRVAKNYAIRQIQINPDNGYAYKYLAIALIGEGDVSGAIVMLKEGLKKAP